MKLAEAALRTEVIEAKTDSQADECLKIRVEN